MESQQIISMNLDRWIMMLAGVELCRVWYTVNFSPPHVAYSVLLFWLGAIPLLTTRRRRIYLLCVNFKEEDRNSQCFSTVSFWLKIIEHQLLLYCFLRRRKVPAMLIFGHDYWCKSWDDSLRVFFFVYWKHLEGTVRLSFVLALSLDVCVEMCFCTPSTDIYALLIGQTGKGDESIHLPVFLLLVFFFNVYFHILTHMVCRWTRCSFPHRSSQWKSHRFVSPSDAWPAWTWPSDSLWHTHTHLQWFSNWGPWPVTLGFEK